MEKLEERSWLKILVRSGVLKDGLMQTSRGYRCVSLDGHECNSLAELEIDNWLFENRIPHEKEPFYPQDSEYNPNGRMRADFKVGELLIEYAGLSGEKFYDEKMENKKRIAKRHGINLIILKPRDLSRLHLALKPAFREKND